MPSTAAIRQQRYEEADLSTGSNQLVLEADANESYVVMDIGVDGANDDTLTEVSIGEESMFAFPSDDGDDSLFREDSLQQFGYSLYGFMREQGLPAPMLQVPEGDDLVVSNSTNSGTATVIYQEGDANLANPNAPGGPESKTRLYPVSGAASASGVGAGTTTVLEADTSRQPAQYDDFPFGTDVPSNREYDLLALAVNLEDSTGSGATIDGVRLTSEEQRFLQSNADFVDAAHAQYPATDPDDGPLVFPASSPGPQTYTPGDDLDLEVEATQGTGSGSGTLQANATFIFQRRGV